MAYPLPFARLFVRLPVRLLDLFPKEYLYCIYTTRTVHVRLAFILFSGASPFGYPSWSFLPPSPNTLVLAPSTCASAPLSFPSHILPYCITISHIAKRTMYIHTHIHTFYSRRHFLSSIFLLTSGVQCTYPEPRICFHNVGVLVRYALPFSLFLGNPRRVSTDTYARFLVFCYLHVQYNSPFPRGRAGRRNGRRLTT
jgi:hypothetical protein